MANESISVLKTYKPPKPGQRRIYRLLGLGIDRENKSFLCPNSREIGNKFLVNDKGTIKSYVFVGHQDPTNSSSSVPSHQQGRIIFTRASRGEISIHGDRPEMFPLDEALFYHQQNRTNIDEPWHVPPKGRDYAFERLDRAKKATHKVEMRERIIEAQRLIYDYTEDEIRDLYELVKKTSPIGMSEDEVRDELYVYAEDDDNARALLILKDDEALKLKKIIRVAKTSKFIEPATNQTTYVWSKGKELLCTKLPRKTLDQSLMIYLVTDEGRDVYKTLKELTKVD
jgi:hypothetical protein